MLDTTEAQLRLGLLQHALQPGLEPGLDRHCALHAPQGNRNLPLTHLPALLQAESQLTKAMVPYAFHSVAAWRNMRCGAGLLRQSSNAGGLTEQLGIPAGLGAPHKACMTAAS